MKTVKLRELAHCRSGEKGNHSNVSVIAYDAADYELLKAQVTTEAVARLYGPITLGPISRYEVAAIGALNFVLEDVLEGGRSRTLAFEESGKALSSLMLAMDVQVSDDYVGRRARLKAANASDRNLSVQAHSDASPGRSVRLGSATGWSRDRFEPAAQLVADGRLDYLCFDSMSEITMSAAQVARMARPDMPGYDPYLQARLEPLLSPCRERGVRIVTNQGWLDPIAAATEVIRMARVQGLHGLKVAAVSGGILTDRIADMGLSFIETDQQVSARRAQIVSAETYLGASGIVQALADGADIVITTRVADACCYLGPLVHEFGWHFEDHHAIARGMIIGHLMECGCQVSGGYFSDPGYKEVPDLDRVGNPIVEVSDAQAVITKLPGTGGVVSEATCKEQLLYEVQDPSRYLCPDVIANLSRVRFEQLGPDRVSVICDDAGLPKTETLKSLVGLQEGFMTEEMVLFAGPGAMARAEQTRDVLNKRFATVDLQAREVRMDYVGLNAVHRESSPPPGDGNSEPYEVVLRIAIKTDSMEQAEKLRREVDPLAVNGASGTGKWATSAPGQRIQPIVGLNSVLVPRDVIQTDVQMLVA